MSNALYNVGGLRFWSQGEITLREQAIVRLHEAVMNPLIELNPAWSSARVEGPILTPTIHISPAYDSSDVWTTQVEGYALRAETTSSSYLYAQHLVKSGKRKLPLCVWQAGKSFRRELNDGARASTLRFNEFWQCEFQCIYSKSTKADYRDVVLPNVAREIGMIAGLVPSVIPSDRLPSYSLETVDIELPWQGGYKEIASVSLRTDYNDPNVVVLEVAVGLDRLVCVSTGEI